MYPSGSDCSSSYTEQVPGPSCSTALECSHCPPPKSNIEDSWAGLDVVTSTLTRGWGETTFTDPRNDHEIIPLSSATLADCRACSGGRPLVHHERITPPSEWSERKHLWPPDQQWSPCCLPDSRCAHQFDEEVASFNKREPCCEMVTKPTSATELRPHLCSIYSAECQVSSKWKKT